MLNFKPSPEQRLAREMARKFCEREIEPVTHLLDEHQLLPYDLIRRFLKEVYGTDALETVADLVQYQQSHDLITRALISIELGRVCPGFALSMGASLELAGYAIAYAGNLEQVERWALPIYR